jgi:isopenicillin N synthase-like dioxygenase
MKFSGGDSSVPGFPFSCKSATSPPAGRPAPDGYDGSSHNTLSSQRMRLVAALWLLGGVHAQSCEEGDNDGPLPRLPLVNISDFLDPGAPDAARLRVAQAWDEAMSTVGMAAIVGHGVDRDLVDALDAGARAFFTLPHAEKMRSSLNRGYGFGGYVPQGVEAVARSASRDLESPADLVENYVFNRAGEVAHEPIAPPAQLQEVAPGYWMAMEALMRSLMRLSALSLGLDESHFDESFALPKCNLRLAYYPPLAAAADERPPGMRYGSHTDYTGYTILRQDPRVAGLEAQLKDGSWVGVPPHDSGLVVNAGDLIQVWTNDRWRSPPHRVANPPSVAADKNDAADEAPGRLSLVFFTGPKDDTRIEALPGSYGPDNPKRYAPVSAGDHLRNKLARSNV